MDNKASFLSETMDEVFSSVPPEEALNASREVVRNYLGSDQNAVGSIHWAEFELNGSFVRAGISDVALMSSQLVTDPQHDPAIAEIVRSAADVGIKAGQLIEAGVRDGHFWCVPYRPRDEIATPVNRTRAILLTEDLFREILSLFNSDAGLTQSEQRIVYQIVLGLNPSSAAEADAVSVETKRTQLKAAAGKLACHSQTELVRLLVSQLIHLLYLCESETSHIQLIERFSAQFMGTLGRLSVQRLPNGRVMRFWEFGPNRGQPILVTHGYLFPSLVLRSEAELRKHGFRLILPVRSGFLDDYAASGAFQSGALVEQNVEDLAQFASCILDEPVPVLGHNMGGFYAMLLAHNHPEICSDVVIASINLLPERKDRSTFVSKFTGGFRKLVNEIGIYEIAARQFQKTTFSSERGARFFFRRLFRECASDLDFLNGSLGTGPAFGWARQIAFHSVIGVSSDLNLMSNPIQEFLRPVSKPVTFVHGPDDPFTSVKEVTDYITANPAATLRVLDKGGHYSCASHPELFWSEVADSFGQ